MIGLTFVGMIILMYGNKTSFGPGYSIRYIGQPEKTDINIKIFG